MFSFIARVSLKGIRLVFNLHAVLDYGECVLKNYYGEPAAATAVIVTKCNPYSHAIKLQFPIATAMTLD